MGEDTHECFECAKTGRGGAYYKWFGHPIIVCSVDNHESIAIIDLKQGLDHLYKDCPLKGDVE